MAGPSIDKRRSEDVRKEKRRNKKKEQKKESDAQGGKHSGGKCYVQSAAEDPKKERFESVAHSTGAISEPVVSSDPRTYETAPKMGEGLSEELVEELRRFLPGQFQFSNQFGTLEKALRSGPGILELYAGSRGFSKAAVRRGCPWTLSFDILHDPSEDLSQSPLQLQLLGLLRRGAFFAMGAGPGLLFVFHGDNSTLQVKRASSRCSLVLFASAV